ncbi:DUF6182 family protein [Streptomyces sporangiiformans]|uniref:Uncharacterized protein n=1 Tax=Streptomyces sporangiiformans TaxID=2315329 RepID=A0A505D8C6_9ACTN|nr:DUF6182 family protein [Streptomyces sporangiiformans]TPQ18602.1 hypothetical protein FGD71_030060 [Streptomyces sporangiiformans]
MTLSPEMLLTVAADRLRTARPEMAARLDVSTPDALRDAKAAIASREVDGPADGAVVAVIGSFSLPRWVHETCRFALSVPADRAVPWRRSFTRTLFLAGRPDNLRERFAFDHIADDASSAWVGPAADRTTTALRRLLKTFSGARELSAWAPVAIAVSGPAASGAPSPPSRPHVHRDLYIATSGLTVSDMLVQVNHLLVEAVLDGLIRPADRLTLRAVPHLSGLAVPFAALRVDTDVHRPHELQAYAALTEET